MDLSSCVVMLNTAITPLQASPTAWLSVGLGGWPMDIATRCRHPVNCIAVPAHGAHLAGEVLSMPCMARGPCSGASGLTRSWTWGEREGPCSDSTAFL